MKKVFVFVVALAAVFAMAVPAGATGVAVSLNAQAELPTFPCVEGGCKVTSLTGTVSAPAGGAPSGALGLGSGGVEYSEPVCEAGTASGNILIGASGDIGISWLRVGAAAVVTLSSSTQTGVAVAAFLPNPAQVVADCGAGGTPGPLSASIVAVAVAVG